MSVLPYPTPPFLKSGLYDPPALSATCLAAAKANWLDLPSTKLSKVNVLFNELLCCVEFWRALTGLDRKSTRLNSSHVRISYAVFCLKKKKNIIQIQDTIH